MNCVKSEENNGCKSEAEGHAQSQNATLPLLNYYSLPPFYMPSFSPHIASISEDTDKKGQVVE